MLPYNENAFYFFFPTFYGLFYRDWETSGWRARTLLFLRNFSGKEGRPTGALSATDLIKSYMDWKSEVCDMLFYY